jgi:hypothetical protein
MLFLRQPGRDQPANVARGLITGISARCPSSTS